MFCSKHFLDINTIVNIPIATELKISYVNWYYVSTLVYFRYMYIIYSILNLLATVTNSWYF